MADLDKDSPDYYFEGCYSKMKELVEENQEIVVGVAIGMVGLMVSCNGDSSKIFRGEASKFVYQRFLQKISLISEMFHAVFLWYFFTSHISIKASRQSKYIQPQKSQIRPEN